MRCELELDERRLLTHPADLDPLGLDVDRPRKDALGSEPGAQESNWSIPLSSGTTTASPSSSAGTSARAASRCVAFGVGFTRQLFEPRHRQPRTQTRRGPPNLDTSP
jgi:hypothetical protein